MAKPHLNKTSHTCQPASTPCGNHTITHFRGTDKAIHSHQEKMREQRGKLPVQAFGDMSIPLKLFLGLPEININRQPHQKVTKLKSKLSLTGVQCTITCWMFILDELWTVNCSVYSCFDKGCSTQEYSECDNADWYHVVIVWRS